MANPTMIGILIFENKPLSQLPAGGSFALLKNSYRSYTNYQGTSSPSLPDYCAISSGSWLGKGSSQPGGAAGTDVGTMGFGGTHSNFFHAVAAALGGYAWKAYEQGVVADSGYATWKTAANNAHNYLSRHCPAAFYTNTDAQPSDAANTNGRFDFHTAGGHGFVDDIAAGTLPPFWFASPNSLNDGHDTTFQYADNWLAGKNPSSDANPFLGITDLISKLPAGALVIVTFDNAGGGNPPSSSPPIPFFVAGPGVTAQTITTNYNHFSTLKGIMQVFGVAAFTDGDLASQFTSATALPLPGGGGGGGDTQPPSVPAGLSAGSVTASSVTINWSASTDNVGVTGYQVFRGGVQISTVNGSTTTYTDATVAGSTTYAYTVLAFDAANNKSAQSSPLNVTTPAGGDTQPPTVPGVPRAGTVTSSSIALSWAASTDNVGVAGYTVYRGGVQVATVAATGYTDMGLQPSTQYTYTVDAFDAAGNHSAKTASLSVTTSTPVSGGPVSFRASTDVCDGSTSVQVTPSNGQVGDTMIAHVTAIGASAISTPSGWVVAGAANDSTAVSVSVQTKTLGAAEPQSVWTCSGATSLTVEVSYAVGAVTVRTAGTAKSSGTAVALTTGTALAGLQQNDEVCTWVSTAAGPRPFADSGCLFGLMPLPSDWSTQSAIAAVEATAGRKLAAAHSMVPWDCHVGAANGDFTASGLAPTVDYNNNRLTYTSWPRPRPGANGSESSWQSVFGTTDPATVMSQIAGGTYDSIIDANATAYKTFGHPIILRLFWEMNGGGVIFDCGQSTSPATYQTNFIAAWKRIVTRTRAVAANVYFHWNPQNFQTTSISRDQLYPGDGFVDFGGTEGYLSPGDTFSSVMTDTSSNGFTYPAIYAAYGPGSSHNLYLGAGESGCRLQASGDSDSAVAGRVNSYASGIPNFPGWKFLVWWNGNGMNGDSAIADQGPLTTTAIQNLIASAEFSPWLDRSWKAVT